MAMTLRTLLPYLLGLGVVGLVASTHKAKETPAELKARGAKLLQTSPDTVDTKALAALETEVTNRSAEDPELPALALALRASRAAAEAVQKAKGIPVGSPPPVAAPPPAGLPLYGRCFRTCDLYTQPNLQSARSPIPTNSRVRILETVPNFYRVAFAQIPGAPEVQGYLRDVLVDQISSSP